MAVRGRYIKLAKRKPYLMFEPVFFCNNIQVQQLKIYNTHQISTFLAVNAIIVVEEISLSVVWQKKF
jgi:hypothetical protein